MVSIHKEIKDTTFQQFFNIKFTSIANEAREIAAAFENEGRFPNVAGIIDGTHVHIRAPEDEPHVYVNRKKCHSLNVQVSFNKAFGIQQLRDFQ
jgi:hypothetical protein